MGPKLFAIKIPEIEKNAMDYISTATDKPLSRLFYKPIRNAIYTNLGLILLYKVDLRNVINISNIHEDLFNQKPSPNQTLPIIEDFVRLILDRNTKKSFWGIFGEIQLNEKDFLLQDFDLMELTSYMGKEYIQQHGSLDEIDLNLAREIFFNYMLNLYFNTTALGSIKTLNNEWFNRQPLIRQFQGQLIAKYLNRFRTKKIEAIKVEEPVETPVEVAEYIE